MCVRWFFTFSTSRLTTYFQLFEERPVWTRVALFNQLTAIEARDILKYESHRTGYPVCSYFFFSAKGVLPLCCYVFQDGPWRDTLVRFSYDPRKDPISRLQVLFLSSPSKTTYLRPFLSYQRLYFRNANHPMSRPSVTTRRHERSAINEHQRTQETERK